MLITRKYLNEIRNDPSSIYNDDIIGLRNDYFKHKLDTMDLENAIRPMREIIESCQPQVINAVSPILQEMKAILDSQDPETFSEIVAEFNVGVMPIALTLVFAIVINYKPALVL
jgi:hypothetical protein